ncbi:hypothetical protein HA402_004917 [Bradysia odoriphaga]|nr:hypothetical protein HA402_004917 [Bradysia odoriphaga]
MYNPIKKGHMPNKEGHFVYIFAKYPETFISWYGLEEGNRNLTTSEISRVVGAIVNHCKLNANVVTEASPDVHEYNFRKADYVGLNSYLSGIDWTAELSDFTEVDAAVERFYDLLKVGFGLHVPLKKFVTNTHPPWYSHNLLNLKNRKSRAHDRFKKTGRRIHKLHFFSLRDEFDSKQKLAFRAYMERTESKLISDPSKFWTYVNSVKKVSGYPSSMFLKDNAASTMQGKCDLFADFFESVYSDRSEDKCFGLDKKVDIGSVYISEA